MIQRHYLSKYSALFPEHFYGMERIKHGDSSKSYPQNPNTINPSLIFHAVVPYIKIKLDRLFHSLKEKYADSSSSFATASLRQKLVKIYLLTYPYIHMFWEGSQVVFYLLYAVRKSPYHSVLMWLQSVQLYQLSSDRFKEMEMTEMTRRQLLGSSSSFKDKAKYLTNNIVSNLVETLTTSFEIGAFFIQFLDWW